MNNNINFRNSLIWKMQDIKDEYLDYQESITSVEDNEEYAKLWNESQKKINALSDVIRELTRLNEIEKVINE